MPFFTAEYAEHAEENQAKDKYLSAYSTFLNQGNCSLLPSALSAISAVNKIFQSKYSQHLAL